MGYEARNGKPGTRRNPPVRWNPQKAFSRFAVDRNGNELRADRLSKVGK